MAIDAVTGVVNHKISKYARNTLTSLAYASTGNVLKV